MSTLHVENLKGLSSGGNANKIIVPSGQTIDASAGTLVPSAGQVVQVKSTLITGTTAVSSNTYGDIMSLAITPKSSTNKILVQASGCLSNNTLGNLTMLKLLRGSTQIASGSAGSYNGSAFFIPAEVWTAGGFAINFLDSPSTTSATTYKIQIAAFNGTGRVGVRGDHTNAHQSIPTFLTLQEIAG